MSKKRMTATSLTILWCLLFASAFHDWTLGLSLGLLFGISYGLFDTENEVKEEKKND